MYKKGFTLIELLVVISIIGLLASIVLAALNSARQKAKDSAIESDVMQLRTLMEEEYADTGSYQGIKTGGGWWSMSDTCTGATSASYGAQAMAVCNAILRTENNCPGGSYYSCLYFRDTCASKDPPTCTDSNNPNEYTIMAYLPGLSASAGSGQFICVGSSGAITIGSPGGNYSASGCWQSP